jgi:alpha-ketoglutarate-dependent taurine dioxygenase
MDYDKLKNDGFLLIEDLRLNPSEFIDLFQQYFELKNYPSLWSTLPETQDKLMLLSDQIISGKLCWASRGKLDWHYDGLGSSRPDHVNILYCIQPSGGETWINDQKRMYDEMPDNIKTIADKAVVNLDPKSIYNIYEITRQEFVEISKTYNTRNEVKSLTETLVKIHPVFSTKGIRYHKNFCKHITNVSNGERAALVSYLDNSFESYIYKHKWERNQVLVIDQCHGVHCRPHHTHGRVLWRAAGWYKI